LDRSFMTTNCYQYFVSGRLVETKLDKLPLRKKGINYTSNNG